ncbi:MAG: hypothetical protein ACKO1M_15025, partial [Planctomycetota bacterium]
MVHQLIVTSVPRGLDGGDGYQAVLRSQGIPPRVAERLKFRSGYSHPFPHGDKRNPVVYLHRVEDVAGGRWHILGRIRDVGSDHTGRSNFLADMLAIDSADARKKSGGPAVVARKSRFRDRWEGPPQAAAQEMVLVGCDDEPRPGDCPAWKGLDPGLAGDLAQAAMEGKRLVLVSRPDDDVLAMFVDAMRLVEPAKRWGVSFNTCAIEAFEGTWKAIRADLPAAGQVRESRDPVIDLTTNPKGSDGAYARFARGETDHLPWQRAVASQPAAGDGEIEPGRGEPLAAGRGGRPQAAGKAVPAAGAEAGMPGRRPPQPGAARRPPLEEDSPPSAVWRVLSVGGIACVLLLLAVAYLQRGRLVAMFRNEPPPPIESADSRPTVQIRPSIGEGKEGQKYRERDKIKEKRQRLAAGSNGRTHDMILQDAEELEREVKRLRGDEGLAITADPDPLDSVATVVDACRRVQDLLERPDVELKAEALDRAFDDLAAQDGALKALREKVDAIAVRERDQKQYDADQAKQKKIAKRRQDAFADFNRLVPIVELPIQQSGTDLGDRPKTTNPVAIDLGPFVVDDLLDPRFRLAVPRDTIDGKPFEAMITD